jgi:hypothetical protein
MQVKYPISLLSNCLCISTGPKKIPVVPKNNLVGMTSKNGIDFFPEEFIYVAKKFKK